MMAHLHLMMAHLMRSRAHWRVGLSRDTPTLLTFSISSPLSWLCASQTGGIYPPSTTLQRSYFDLRRWETPDGIVHFQLPYGAWIRLFRDSSMVVVDLLELPAPNGPIPGYLDEQRRSWAEQWPSECI